MPTHGETLLRLGWLAGSVLAPAGLEFVRPYLRHAGEEPPRALDPHDWWIVASQSCDLLHHNDENEPFVELLRGCPVQGKPRTQFVDLRSTRRIDFRPNRQKFPDLVLTAHATIDRYVVPRSALVGSSPDPDRVLSEIATERIQAWLALRASRPAWPNALVERLKAVQQRLVTALENVRDDVAEVRVAINPKTELTDDRPYKVVVWFVVPHDKYESADVRATVQAAYATFTGALARCVGVSLDVDISGVVSGDDFSWGEFRGSELWNFSYLTVLGD